MFYIYYLLIMKTTEEIRREYVEKSQQARYNTMLSKCTPADRQAVKLVAHLDEISGGQIDRLVAVYKTIKQQS